MIIFEPEIGIKDYIKDQMVAFGYSYKDSSSYEDDLIKVFSLKRKIPESIPRTIIELPNIAIPNELRAGYDSLKKKITSGESIKGHLSKSIVKTDYNDLLLNSWNIHHLHLSNIPSTSGFFERTGPVLFAIFFKNVAVFIDILSHGIGCSDVWVNTNLIEKLHKYLPQSIANFKLNNIRGESYSPSEMRALRSKHCNFTIQVADGTVYGIMGLMSNGNSFFDIYAVMKIKSRIDYYNQVINQEPDTFKKALNIPIDSELLLTIAMDDNDIMLYAPAYKTAININNPLIGS
ncbi:hypothetical protein REX01_000129 [Klebsiella aerogenes]|uniref:hypothetical protein n=1 Tax=Klebsiella aerogenes TaxID=548 RepID=UPI0027E83626|nr:hypothetical protein [Klebsiella aerogenes]